jgi:hypothetical protein
VQLQAQIAQLRAGLDAANANAATFSCEQQQQLVPRVSAPTPLDVAAVVAAIPSDALSVLQPDQLQRLARLAARTGDVMTAMMLLRCVSKQIFITLFTYSDCFFEGNCCCLRHLTHFVTALFALHFTFIMIFSLCIAC